MPEVLTPPAPVTPAAPAAPASTPASTPSAPAAPATSSTPAASEENPYAELDATVKRVDTPPQSTKGKDAPPKTGTTAPSKPTATPPEKTTAVPKELRAELDRVKTELKNKEGAYATLEAKIADYERKGKDTTALTERLSTLEKQIETKDSEIRALKQEASPEFKKKYDEPFNRLAERAKSVVQKIQVTDEAAGTVRPATWGEFSQIYSLDEFSALRQAKETFGEDGAQVAMSYYRELHRLDDDRQVALAEEKEQWKERETAEQANQIKTREEIARLWLETNASLAEKVDDYHDSPDDKELVDARNRALAIFDAQPKTFKEKLVKDAHNRQRVAAFAPMKILISRLTKERDDLKTELESMKEKPPGKTSRAGGTAAAPAEDDFETGLRKTFAS